MPLFYLHNKYIRHGQFSLHFYWLCQTKIPKVKRFWEILTWSCTLLFRLFSPIILTALLFVFLLRSERFWIAGKNNVCAAKLIILRKFKLNLAWNESKQIWKNKKNNPNIFNWIKKPLHWGFVFLSQKIKWCTQRQKLSEVQ